MAFAALESLDTILGVFRKIPQSVWDVFELHYTQQQLDYIYPRGVRSFRKITPSEWHELDLLCSTLQRLDDTRYRGIDRSEINEWEAKITEAAWKLEDVIESYQVISQDVDEEGVEEEIHSFFTTAKKLREEYESALRNSRRASVEEDHIIHDAANSTTVGLSDLSEEIISELLDDSSEKGEIFSIWGMAGIGKTHLARDVYHHPLIVQRFELRLWVSIGQKAADAGDIKKIYAGILAQIEGKPIDLFMKKNLLDLSFYLQGCLFHRKFLIVLDDIWSPTVLKYCIDALPQCQNKQSILITTRIFGLAETMYDNNLGPNKIWGIPFLSNEESWNLLSQNVFVEKPFLAQLEKPGRKIAEICEGLPLLILAVADILRGLDQTEEYWNKVAQKKTNTFPDAYDRIYKTLVSSYDYLYQRYKAGFLYMGVFRQSHEIPVSRLIHLWNLEGLYGDNQLMNVFVSNSIAIANTYSSNERIKSCKLHSAYWYVCVTEARKTKLFHILIKLTDVSIERPRRLSVQNNMLFGIKEVYDSMAAATSLTRSLLFTGEDHPYPVRICFNRMLLMKVLDALAINFYEFPNEVLNLFLLRYLALTHNGEVPSSISRLQCLQFLTLRRHHNIKLLHRDSTTCLPNEIWDVENLWYLRIRGSKLPDPSRDVELPNLSRLYVNADSCTEGVLRGSPALEKLGIEIELEPEGGAENSLRCLEHTGLLDKLESLKCVVVNPRLIFQVVAPPNQLLKLPESLQKLSLKGMGYPWKYVSAIGSLPNLKVLKLKCSAFRGVKWEIKDGQFRRLEFLQLEDLDVVQWTMEEYFPHLRHLIVRHCYRLKMIPSLPRMDGIMVDDCPLVTDNANLSHLESVINSSWNL